MRNIIPTLAIFGILAGVSWEFFEPEIRGMAAKVFDLPGQTEVDEVESGEEAGEKKSASVKKSNPQQRRVEPVAPDLDRVPRASSSESLRSLIASRYPLPDHRPFEEVFSKLDAVPEESYPDRVQIKAAVELAHKEGNRVFALSKVKADGWVRPVALEEGKLLVASLADSRIRGDIQLEQTNFREEVASLYDQVHAEAIERVETMRESDFEEISSVSFLMRKLIRQDKPWDPPEAPIASKLIDSLQKKYPDDEFTLVGFHDFGNQDFGRDDLYPGRHPVVIVALEGKDRGLGPFQWRAKCLFDGNEILGWLDLPDSNP